MTTYVERSIEVEVPVRTVYDQWTQFEEFPRFMSGVQEVRQVGDALTHWVAEIGGVRREWDAAILEQVPDEKVAWAATTGATNAGAVYFTAVGEDRTQVRLTLEFEPEGVVERLGDIFDVVDRQAVADLDRFKEFIEQQGSASGGWRGRVDDGDVQAAGAGAVAGGVDVEDVPGDVVAVGPTEGTHSTLDTETGSAQNPTLTSGEGQGVGHSGDPVAVDPELATPPTGTPVTDQDLPGDVVAVGPTGGTHSTLDTETGSAQNPTLTSGEGQGVGHSGDPVAVDPELATPPTGTPAVTDRDLPGDVVAVGPTEGTQTTLETEGTDTPAPVPEEGPGVGHSGDPVAVQPPAGTGGPNAGAAADPVGGSWSDATGSPEPTTSTGVGSRWNETGETVTDPRDESWFDDAGTAAQTPGTAASSRRDETGETATGLVGGSASEDTAASGTQTEPARGGRAVTGMGGARSPREGSRPTEG